MNFLKTTVLSALALVATLGLAQAAPKIGYPAPAFSAVDTTGKTWSLAELKGKRIILEWTNDQCPYVLNNHRLKPVGLSYGLKVRIRVA